MRLLMKLVLVGLLVWGAIELRDPHRTSLPFGTDDLSSVQDQLARLPEDERELVTAYVRRSRGDVLTPAMADPDVPLTARTFADAIKLQRRYLVFQAEQNAKIQARKAERDSKLEPLRAALSLRLIKREIMTADEATGRSPEPAPVYPGAAKQALSPLNNTQVLVSTYRLRNISNTTIDSAKVSVTIRKASPRLDELGILANCYIEHDTPLVQWDGASVRCAQLNKPATEQDRAYAAMDESQFIVDYEPRLIRFADGRELKFND